MMNMRSAQKIRYMARLKAGENNDTESSPDKRRIYRCVRKRTNKDLQLPLQKITLTGATVHRQSREVRGELWRCNKRYSLEVRE